MGGVLVHHGSIDVHLAIVWGDYTESFRTTELFVVLSACGKLHYVLQETLLAHGECAAQQWLLS